ncbi:MAG: deoxyribodipyrimidine photo-lyase [Gemmatimonadota bacterium]|nr:deoxyribodipyrimidine photo-lyase [Gemmatimonadota bacterium]MDH3427317.1 deoxyribodipyrimidine photo-lyase [Gemmatimonadota bacterium]
MPKFGFTPYRDLVRGGAPTEDDSSAAARVRTLRGGSPNPRGSYVLYWMQMFLRGAENAALDEAVRRANELGLPLVVYQGLNPNYPEANDRTHTFILECARDVSRDLAARGITYRFHLRRSRSESAQSIVSELARAAASVVVDDFPAFILPRMTQSLVRRTEESGVPIHAVDANGLVPLADIPDRQYAAYTIRPRLHARIPEYLLPLPSPEPANRTPAVLPIPENRFENLVAREDSDLATLVAECDIDHSVLPSLLCQGGRREGRTRLESFIDASLPAYAKYGNDPGRAVTSGLSAYLHFGCLSTGEIVRDVLRSSADDEASDAFLEQVVIRRELAFNFCRYTPVSRHANLEALPDWARKTLSEHASDERSPRYSLEQLEAARTHDEIWNAAQRELVATGTFHGYLRMLWGKNVIRWTETYEEAQSFMVRMHHRYALDGRSPNTYASILWCFGLHDRAFREMPVLGKLRPLNSSSTRRKFNLDPYFRRVAAAAGARNMPVLAAENLPGNRRAT